MESIKHSVSNFMNILLIASTKGVIKWDTQMFDCALAWAIYCEQLCEVIEESKWHDDIRAHLDDYFQSESKYSSLLHQEVERAIKSLKEYWNDQAIKMSKLLLHVGNIPNVQETAVRWCEAKRTLEAVLSLHEMVCAADNRSRPESQVTSSVTLALARALLHRLMTPCDSQPDMLQTLLSTAAGETVAQALLNLPVWHDEDEEDVRRVKDTVRRALFKVK